MRLLSRKIRGFRLVDLVGLSLLVAIILGVYLAKTIAGRERAEIATIERQIKQEKARIRLLQAEVAHLEKPGRIERLAVEHLGLEPVSANREASPDQLVTLAAAGPPKKAKPWSPVAAMLAEIESVPGVPPPDPDRPVRLAEAAP